MSSLFNFKAKGMLLNAIERARWWERQVAEVPVTLWGRASLTNILILMRLFCCAREWFKFNIEFEKSLMAPAILTKSFAGSAAIKSNLLQAFMANYSCIMFCQIINMEGLSFDKPLGDFSWPWIFLPRPWCFSNGLSISSNLKSCSKPCYCYVWTLRLTRGNEGQALAEKRRKYCTAFWRAAWSHDPSHSVCAG